MTGVRVLIYSEALAEMDHPLDKALQRAMELTWLCEARYEAFPKPSRVMV